MCSKWLILDRGDWYLESVVCCHSALTQIQTFWFFLKTSSLNDSLKGNKLTLTVPELLTSRHYIHNIKTVDQNFGQVLFITFYFISK